MELKAAIMYATMLHDCCNVNCIESTMIAYVYTTLESQSCAEGAQSICAQQSFKPCKQPVRTAGTSL